MAERKKVRPVVLGRVHLTWNTACEASFCGQRIDFVDLHERCTCPHGDKLGTLQFIPDPPQPKKRGKR